MDSAWLCILSTPVLADSSVLFKEEFTTNSNPIHCPLLSGYIHVYELRPDAFDSPFNSSFPLASRLGLNSIFFFFRSRAPPAYHDTCLLLLFQRNFYLIILSHFLLCSASYEVSSAHSVMTQLHICSRYFICKTGPLLNVT